MAHLKESEIIVGQPFRLGSKEGAIFQAANRWTVFYLRYPDGEWLHMPRADWARLAIPVWIDPDLLLTKTGVLGKTRYVPIGMRVDHKDYGRGYVIAHGARQFEVCFVLSGPKKLPFLREWAKMTPIAGDGECWPDRAPGRDKLRAVKAENTTASAPSAPGTSLETGVRASAKSAPTLTVRQPQSAEAGLQTQRPAMAEASDIRASIGLTLGLPRRPGSHDRRPCSCAGGNENCVRCDGTGWIRPNEVPHPVRKADNTKATAIPVKPKSLYRSPDSDFFERPRTSGSGSVARKGRNRTVRQMVRCAACGQLVRQTKLASHKSKCPKRPVNGQKSSSPKQYPKR